jgi:hypothetical protein
MVMAGRRRRRQPRWIVLAVMLTVLVLAVNAAVSSRSKEPSRHLERLAYLDAVRPQVQSSNDQGAELADLRDKATELGRAGITKRMERLRRESAAVVAAVRDAEPPGSLEGTNSLLVATMVARARSVATIEQSLKDALGTQPPGPAVGALVQAGADLVTADRTYELFVRALPAGEGKEAALPRSTWVSDGGLWDRPAVTAFVTTLRSTETLAAVHDVAVVLVNSDPAPLGREGEADLMAVGRTIRLQIVVANVGNEAEKKVTVVATLTGADGAADMAREFVNLAPGQRRTVTLGGLRPPAAQPVTLTVSVGPVPGETQTDTNQITRQLVFR